MRIHTMIRPVLLGLAALAFSVGIEHQGWADESIILYSTSFEPPKFQVGNHLVGLDGWTGVPPPSTAPNLNPTAATITNVAACDGHQSVQVNGGGLGGLVDSGGNTPPYAAVGSYRRPLSPPNGQTVPADGIVQVQACLLLETKQPPTAPGVDFFSLTIAAKAGSGETYGEIGLSSAGTVVGYAFNAAPGATAAVTTPIMFNQWYHIGMVLDFANRTTSYYLNDQLLGTVPWTSTPNNVLTRASMVVYALPDSAVSKRVNYTARFDLFRVKMKSQDLQQ